MTDQERYNIILSVYESYTTTNREHKDVVLDIDGLCLNLPKELTAALISFGVLKEIEYEEKTDNTHYELDKERLDYHMYSYEDNYYDFQFHILKKVDSDLIQINRELTIENL